jgi:hypothetical protein
MCRQVARPDSTVNQAGILSDPEISSLTHFKLQQLKNYKRFSLSQNN